MNSTSRRLSASACVLSCALFAHTADAAPGLSAPEAVGSFLDGAFPNTSPGTSANADWVQEDYYSLPFVEPLRIIEHPVEDRLIIVCKDGRAFSVSHQPGAMDQQPFFDIQSIMHGKSDVGEGGISDLVFHPEFGQAGSPNATYVYISYRFSPGRGGTFDNNPTIDGYNRLSRFEVVGGQVDLSTELVMINQFDREQWHIGMDLLFGKDGFLYISVGDEGNCCNRQFSTQRLDGGLWSGILRIDVDQDPTRSHPIRRQPTHLEKDPSVNGAGWPASSTQGYFIPNDNPFLDEAGGRLEEFYSIGLRHPWTISVDEETGNLWVADVGQSDREEIDLVRKGDNHQWGWQEGLVPGVIAKPAQVIGNETPPIWDYDRAQGNAVIGAGVYRGEKFPELIGKYLFSDFMTGRLWTATPVGESYAIDEVGELTSGFASGVNSYLLDSKGDILLAKSGGALGPMGHIQRLVRSADSPMAPEPPALLSATGAFTDLATLTPRAGCIPYELNVPFWSDNAVKSRWMCVPNDGAHDTAAEQVTISAEGDWVFPTGSVLIKHFEVLTNECDPASAVRVETRFLIQGEDRHYGVAYRWNEAGTDAELLTTDASIDLAIQTPNGPQTQTWRVPARNKCLTCHGAATVGVLGPKLRQLNRDMLYASSGLMGNQVETLSTIGLLQMPPTALDSMLKSTPTGNACATIEDRARSYIDANCAYCHRPNGVRANFDARLTTPLDDAKIINGSLVESQGIAGEAVLVPGDLTKSVMYLRANSVGQGTTMPPLAKSMVDEAGMAVLKTWIEAIATGDPSAGMEGCNPNGMAGQGPVQECNPSGTAGQGGGQGGAVTGPGVGGANSTGGTNGVTPMGGPGATPGSDSGCACVIGPVPGRADGRLWLLGALAAALAVRRRRAPQAGC
jgi:uncharacterized repeat protein (TIGR03806 family)